LFVSRAATAADPDRVEWSLDWQRVRPWQVAGTFVLVLTDVGIQLWATTPTEARFRGTNFFDDWARDALKGRSLSTQANAESLSDVFFYGSVLVPFVVDASFGALALHQNSDVAVQMLAIDLQSFAFAGLFTISAEKLAGRARPYMRDCGPDGLVRDATGRAFHTCGIEGNRSFFAGHPAAATTAAGLVCVHHQHLPLFGGGLADLGPCLVMIGVAGILRMVADDHWATDVLLGWSVGAFSGYVLPSLLHYGFGKGRPLAEIRTSGLDLVPTLMPVHGGAGLGAVGTF
jgi:membrane-associated phospholipid phosphatase